MLPSASNYEDPYLYLNGLGDSHKSEAVRGVLPIGNNSPEESGYWLYTEQIPGSVSAYLGADLQHTCLCRTLPSAVPDQYQLFVPTGSKNDSAGVGSYLLFTPEPLVFDPFGVDETADWITGMQLVSGAGDPSANTGISIYTFSAGRDMPPKQAYYSADGDFLVVLQQGVLDVQTELGKFIIRPNEVLVIPRGIRYRITLPAGPVRGFSLELHQGHFKLPEACPSKSKARADPQDFQIPVAFIEEDIDGEWTIVRRFYRELSQIRQNHCPFDVLAWYGRYYPYKYNLDRYNNPIRGSSTSSDRMDPSLFTVLTAPSNTPGVTIADFVIFPAQRLEQKDNLRPPWFHRNTMAEFSSIIDAGTDLSAFSILKPAGAFLPIAESGNADRSKTVNDIAVSDEDSVTAKDGAATAFMFESSLSLGVTEWAVRRSKTARSTAGKDWWRPRKRPFEFQIDRRSS